MLEGGVTRSIIVGWWNGDHDVNLRSSQSCKDLRRLCAQEQIVITSHISGSAGKGTSGPEDLLKVRKRENMSRPCKHHLHQKGEANINTV
jgi:hypothetical protein